MRSTWAAAAASALALVVALPFGGCDSGLETGEMVGSICEAGQEVFCRCKNGVGATRRCDDHGGGFSQCGPCDVDGGDEDPGEGPSSSSGGGASGGKAPLLAACDDDSDCASDACEHGYCTRDCATPAECPGGSSCVHASSVQVCMPTCDTEADCDGFGSGVQCGYASGVDGSATTVCADWDEVPLPPLGSPCSSDADCDLGHIGKEAVCSAAAECVQGCVQPNDCPAGKTCVSSGGIGDCE